jgi:acyl-CoA thioesterase-2
MDPSLADLITLLELEPLEERIFRGQSRDIGTPQVFGGQVLGQALNAAQATVEERTVHSLHAYFLRRGDFDSPIIYEVDRSRDGGSFSARRVVAIQHGHPIFTLAASFQASEHGLEFHPPLPRVPPPEELTGVREYETRNLERMPDKVRRLLKLSESFDLRPVELGRGHAGEDLEWCRQFWLRTADRLPEDAALHRAILAYVSDYGLLTTTLQPHGIHFTQPGLQMASIDHAMWFHRPFRMDEWLLYVMQSPNAGKARGLAFGKVYNREGVLVASVAQEGLIRKRGK